MRFLSRPKLLTLVVVGAVLVPLLRIVPTIADATNVIIQEGTVQREDLYALGNSVFIEGVVDGDLIVATGKLTITGEVTGDVLGVVWDRAVITGTVGGSVRLGAVDVTTTGTIGDDLALVAWSADAGGEVGRDIVGFAAGLRIGGTVGRDVRGQIGSFRIAGTVERSIDVAVRQLKLDSTAVVGGDLSYGSETEAEVADGSEVAGTFTRRDARTQLWYRAARRVIGIGSVFALVFAGIALAWLFRRTWHRSVQAVQQRPGRTILVGLAATLGAPVAAVLLAITLVGLPLAVILFVLWLSALFLGPIPALAAGGERVLRGKGGLLAGFVVATVLWRGAMWVLPLVGGLLYLVVTVWGIGGWVLGAWETRRESALSPDDDPFMRRGDPVELPEGWEPPLAP